MGNNAGDHNKMRSAQIVLGPIAATNAKDMFFYRANRSFRIVGMHAALQTGSTSATLQIEKSVGGAVAIGSGVDLLATEVDTTAVTGLAIATPHELDLVTTAGALELSEGDWLAMDWSGDVSSLVGLFVTIDLEPL